MIAAAIQICSTSKREENYKKVAHYIAKAASDGAKLIVLPEHWDRLGKPQEKKSYAESTEGPSIRFIQELAKQFQCWIVAGSIAEVNAENPPYNTCVVVTPEGKLGKWYRKIHLFDAELAGGHKESNFTCAGTEVTIQDVEEFKLGIAICYDVRFPELFRKLASLGAQIFVLPSNFTALTGTPHWEVLVRARAIENQCYVIASDQTGMTGTGWEAHGHSMIVSPWGEILALLGREEGYCVADLDLKKLEQIRHQMPVHSHRRF